MFLAQADIFSFEQCCRDSYRMINKLTFLTHSNSFKEFTMDNNILNQIVQKKYDLFKYSRAKKIEFNIERAAKIYDKFNEMLQLSSASNAYYSNWFFNLLTSITCLSLENWHYAPCLLDLLPIDILFDP